MNPDWDIPEGFMDDSFKGSCQEIEPPINIELREVDSRPIDESRSVGLFIDPEGRTFVILEGYDPLGPFNLDERAKAVEVYRHPYPYVMDRDRETTAATT